MKFDAMTLGNRPYMAAMLIWAAVFLALIGSGDGSSEYSAVLYRTFAVTLAVPSAVLMLSSRFNMVFTVGIMTMIIAVVSLGISFVQMSAGAGLYSVCGFMRSIDCFALAVIGLLVYAGMRANVVRIRFLSVMYCAIGLLPFTVDCLLSNQTLGAVIDEFRLELLCLVPIVLLMLMILHPDVCFMSNKKAFKLAVERLHDVKPHVSSVFIERADIELLASHNAWKSIPAGPVVAEKTVPLIMDSAKYDLVLSRWSDGMITGDIMPDDRSTHVQSTRFVFREAVVQESRVFVFGEEGFYFAIDIIERRERVLGYTRTQKALIRLLHLEE